MSKRRVPVFATIVVLLAVGVMIALGVWQLQRLQWKEALLARYSAAASAEPAPYPAANQAAAEAVYYRRSNVDCRYTSGEWASIAGRSAAGEAGYAHMILCGIGDGKTAWVQAGWSRSPKPPQWSGGRVSGHIAPYNLGFARLVADPPLAGLAASARPDPSSVPNNHLAYAGQWFFFALTALVIYALALRRRWKG